MDSLIKTPYYLIDKSKLLRNLAKRLPMCANIPGQGMLALKVFCHLGSVFDLMQQYMDGTTSRSPCMRSNSGGLKFAVKKTHGLTALLWR